MASSTTSPTSNQFEPDNNYNSSPIQQQGADQVQVDNRRFALYEPLAFGLQEAVRTDLRRQAVYEPFGPMSQNSSTALNSTGSIASAETSNEEFGGHPVVDTVIEIRAPSYFNERVSADVPLDVENEIDNRSVLYDERIPTLIFKPKIRVTLEVPNEETAETSGDENNN